MPRTKHRRQSGGFVMVLNSMMKSPAWQDLSGNAVKLLLHLTMLSQGNNGHGHTDEPGELFLSEREAATAIGVSRNTASAGFAELIEHGFLRAVRCGHFQVKLKIATVWRLTFQPYPRAHQGPTNEWRSWRCEQNSREQKLNGTGAKIAHWSEALPITGAKIGPVELENGRKPPRAGGPKIEPHIDIPRGGGASERIDVGFNPAVVGAGQKGGDCGWWGADASTRVRISARLAMLAWITAEPMRAAA